MWRCCGVEWGKRHSLAAAVPELGAVGIEIKVTPRQLLSVLPRRFPTRQFKRCTRQQPRVDSSREAALAREISGVLRGRAPKRLFFRPFLWGAPKKGAINISLFISLTHVKETNQRKRLLLKDSIQHTLFLDIMMKCYGKYYNNEC